jgi:galactokinase/mevalonate kinase-like predicted kinase
VLDLVISTASEITLEQQKMTPHKKRELYTMLPMVGEAENVVLNAGRPRDEFGRLLHESWQLKRSLSRLKKLLCVPFTFSAKSSDVAVYELE